MDQLPFEILSCIVQLLDDSRAFLCTHKGFVRHRDDVTYLDVSYEVLSAPICFSSWPKLDTVFMQFSRSPPDYLPLVLWPPVIREIDLSGNKVAHHVQGIQWPPTLSVIRLSWTAIRHIVQVDWPVHLVTLDLSHNNIFYVDVDWPQTLRTLNLSMNVIESVEGVQWPASLTNLDLSFNNIHYYTDVWSAECRVDMSFNNLY